MLLPLLARNAVYIFCITLFTLATAFPPNINITNVETGPIYEAALSSTPLSLQFTLHKVELRGRRPDLPKTITAKIDCLLKSRLRESTARLVSIDGLTTAPLPIALGVDLNEAVFLSFHSEFAKAKPKDVSLPDGKELKIKEVNLCLVLDGSHGVLSRFNLGYDQDRIEYWFEDNFPQSLLGNVTRNLRTSAS